MRRAATSLQVQPGQPFGQPAVLGRLLFSLRVGQQLRSLDVASRVWPTQKKTNVLPVNGTKCANTSRRCKYMYVCGCLTFFPPGYSCESAFAHVHANRRSTLFFLPVCVVCGVCSFFLPFPSPFSLPFLHRGRLERTITRAETTTTTTVAAVTATPSNYTQASCASDDSLTTSFFR